MRNRRSAKGFTLIEMAIVTATLGIVLYVFMSGITPWLNAQDSMDTTSRLKEVQNAITTAYQESQQSVDTTPGAVLALSGGTLSPAGSTGGICQSNDTTFAPVVRFASSSAAILSQDGYHNRMCLYITSRLSNNSQGITLYYHNIAVISGGSNGVIESGACNSGMNASGQLTLCGDDKGILIDGYAIALNNYKATVAKMDKIATAYQGYFSTRYQLDPTRDVAKDYLAASGNPASRWDSAGTMPSTGCAGFINLVSSSGTSPNDVLGLSLLDVTDAYGQTIQFDNCSNAVRSPNNATATMQTPPYTALLQTTLPGAVTLQQTVLGAF